MNIISADNISKSYGEKTLFDNISINIESSDKIGLIGINGTGKSTLLKIIAGIETMDSGVINSPKDTKIEYLSQDPEFNEDLTVLENIFKGDSPAVSVVREYEKILLAISKDSENVELQNKLTSLSAKMDSLNAWELESQAKTILTKLGISNFDDKVNTLSGGQKKRVALAASLITPCDLLILDEPTNHMDNRTIDWLENYLENRKGALIMITHDRYFLDRVVNRTIELDHGRLYTYSGNYSEFIEKKIERKALEATLEKKRQNLYKKELEWIRKGAKARTTKQKARIKRFEDLEESKIDTDEPNMEISVGSTRLGKKIIEISNLSKSFGEKKIIGDLNYILLREDIIGIIGDNGVGKSTLLNLLYGRLSPDKGNIDIGATVKIGYFSQESEDMNEDLRAIEYIREGGEFISDENGNKISASQMMERFLFTPDMQWTYIKKLSGGERRRLYLLRILMEAPNVLLLDEPTNDLDIETLNILESYIDELNGVVVTVSHDRYFLDRVCSKIFSFEGDGEIVIHTGNYSDFIKYKNEFLQSTSEVDNENIKNEEKKKKRENKNHDLKFSYKEKLEFEKIDSDIETLENRITDIEKEMNKYSSDFVKLQELVTEKENVEEELLYKLERWEYLNDINDQIQNQES
ncbi:MAG: ABC-F family ATP-binding cassette domain-containing protein [Firmicutes bacterium]|nr:ABC-F family ATP-binding cassette domain-containing protein [Bacillota bacterium]